MLAAVRQKIHLALCPDSPGQLSHCAAVGCAADVNGGRKGLMFCKACRMQFTVTVGTALESSKIPLHTWLDANHLLCLPEKHLTTDQLRVRRDDKERVVMR